MPEVNDEFAKNVGAREATVEGLKSEIKLNLERERDQAILSRVKAQVLKGLEKKNPIDVPKALVDQEIEKVQEQAKQQNPQQELPDMDYEKEATVRVILSLLIRKLIEDYDVKLDSTRVSEMLQRVASSYGDPTQIMQYYQQNPELMQSFEAAVMEEQVIELVAEKAKINEIEMSFDELGKAPYYIESEEE